LQKGPDGKKRLVFAKRGVVWRILPGKAGVGGEHILY
jgi:hypothetical protein